MKSNGSCMHTSPVAEKFVDMEPSYWFNSSCFGDVAQLGERSVRNAEAEGSNPFISTMITLDSDLLRVFF